MDKKTAKDLMVPIDQYATVKIGTTLLEAVLALDKAQELYTESKYQHRAILVLDNNNMIVGKIGQLRVLKAVETRYDLNEELDDLAQFGFSPQYLNKRKELSRLKGPILNKESLKAAAEKRVEEFMQQPTPGEFVSEDCTIDVVIHRLVAGTHLSLLVTNKDKITGIVKMADVFAAVFSEMRDTCIE